MRLSKIRLSSLFTCSGVILALLVALAILSWPVFSHLRHEGRRARVAGDIRRTGHAMMDYLVHEINEMERTGADPGLTSAEKHCPAWEDSKTILITCYEPIEIEELRNLLVPRYIDELPIEDPWGYRFEFRMNRPFSLQTKRTFLIRSPGSDGKFSDDEYKSGPFDPDEEWRDVVWADGLFVRWPQSVPGEN